MKVDPAASCGKEVCRSAHGRVSLRQVLPLCAVVLIHC